jgi:hypothetical protein
VKDRQLFEVSVVVDDDTGIWDIGELDYGVPVETSDWLDAVPGRRARLAAYVRNLANSIESGRPPFAAAPREHEEGGRG